MSYTEILSLLTKENERARITNRGNVEYIKIEDIVCTLQAPPALTVDSFSQSLNSNGFFEPLTFDDSMRLCDGTKRLYAARVLDLKEIPVTFSANYPMLSDYIISLISSSADFFEKADLLSLLSKKFLISRDLLAERLGCTVSAVSNKIRLSAFSDEERTLISSYSLSERHARTILRLPRSLRLQTIEFIGSQKLSVANSEEYIDSLLRVPSLPFENVSKKIGKSILSACKSAEESNFRYELTRRENPDSVVYSVTVFK